MGTYRVDISDPKTLAIELAAVVKNELADLDDAEMRLISGFSSVEFAHVRSPVAPGQSWETFFQQLQGGPQSRYTFTSVSNNKESSLVSNAQVFAPERGFGLAAGATPLGEGVDLHFQPIGKRTLAKGEALSLSIAKEKAAYERIVEWLIPDKRGGDTESEDSWDALRFKNPFKFPMTTGPAMVTAQGQFNGQRTSNYVSAGEETMLRITKALSVRTRHTEQEAGGKDGERAIVYVGGRRYQKSTIAAELLVSNHRGEDIKIIIRRRFSGELVHADGQPQTSLREEGVYSVNKRNEMVWVFGLKGGDEKRLSYSYNVLVAQ